MKLARMLRTEKGFSLVELMIVVAIIGILSAIAIPNFQRYQQKARQSEAKNNLAAYFGAQKASFSEYGRYVGNFVAVGFKPDGLLKYRISALDGGMSTSVTPIPTPNDPACIDTNRTACTGMTITWREDAAFVAAPAACAPANTATAFIACGSANIGGTQVDTWSMDERKQLTNGAAVGTHTANLGQSGLQ